MIVCLLVHSVHRKQEKWVKDQGKPWLASLDDAPEWWINRQVEQKTLDCGCAKKKGIDCPAKA